ncbi:thiamine phosphate synthase [Shimia sp. CNT1-13L.2]|uniref:thiamine phosphate synthase n=1 Tax=Shimia sp. CNT1-13L.2 TaxID=2959663 RepID=UPI0020CEFBB9|nr:thiamine phosphate synthase [Shimia sp. CNT1-13L.2]MCP9482136.1 thiamine phosphate synthase [Shimia sp. CNT1-13L.2]
MAETELPQIYLITPPEIELSRFPEQLARVLDDTDIACVRLALATQDEDRISRAADALRETCHARDVAIVIAEHVVLAERLGLDGVHLTDGARSMRKTRKDLGDDAIVGAYCGASRHDGMTAGEQGADYISFGPVGSTPLGDGTVADHELFEWWSQMIEVPVVAEGALDVEIIRKLSPVTDFFGIGEEIWRAEDPVAQLAEFKAAFS